MPLAHPEDDGYTGAPVAGAFLATAFFPLLSLIAALLLQSSESNPRKKAQLRMWAWLSGAWLALGVIIVVLALIAFGVFAATVVDKAHSLNSGFPPTQTTVHDSAPCRGGPVSNAVARHVRGNLYAIPCKFGGTTTVPIVIPGH